MDNHASLNSSEQDAPKKELDPVAKLKAQNEAEKEKKLGTELYKKREFDAAIEHYEKAWGLNKDISYLTNIGAALFEKGDFTKCIEKCEGAIEKGREMHADFKMIARAFGRIGTSYEKLDDLPNAIKNYQHSLTEHRTPDVLAKLRKAEKTKIQLEKDAYVNEEEAEKARLLGQERFKAADWPGAVEAYTEMTKRAPDDPRGYSNRAACFIKLLAYSSSSEDCDIAIKKDPSFIRAYIRKSQALFAMREYNKALDVCDEAEQRDTQHAFTREIEQSRQKLIQAQFSAREGESEEETLARIQRDPDIVKILQDPVISAILQQAKNDPSALQEHLKNPQVRSSIQKLIAAGVIRLSR